MGAVSLNTWFNPIYLQGLQEKYALKLEAPHYPGRALSFNTQFGLTSAHSLQQKKRFKLKAPYFFIAWRTIPGKLSIRHEIKSRAPREIIKKYV